MNEFIGWFNQVLTISIQLYFQQECEYSSLEEVKPPVNGWLEKVTGVPDLTFDERMVVMLALMPHVCPQILDIFFVQNKNFDRQYTEFGGWKGLSHGGFLPTGETASFILAGEDTEKRKGVIRFFQKDHWFYTKNILRLEGAGEGEPFLSGQLRVSEEFLSRVLLDKEYKPDYNIGFPAKRITTQLEWEDMVLDDVIKSQAGYLNPYILEERQLNVTQLDVFSRLMMDRIIFLGTQVDDYTANTLQAQLLYLDSVEPGKDISIYINSPGGSVYAGLGIYDTMQFITSDVATICTGMAASMAAVLLVAGAEGKRSALTHSRVMIHQPMGGAQGQASDIEITAREIQKLKKELYTIIADHSHTPFDKVWADSDRDYWMTAQEAKEYGMVDEVLIKK